MYLEKLSPAERIAATMARIYEKDLTTTSGGNVSVYENGNILISPSSLDKGALTPEQISLLDENGNVLNGVKPSVEILFHSAIYKARKDIKAIVHAHSPALLAFTITHKTPDMNIIPKFGKYFGPVGYADYSAPGTRLLCDYVAGEFSKGCNVVFMKNHGICIGAETLTEALEKLEMAEMLAKIECTAKRAGEPIPVENRLLGLIPDELPFSYYETAFDENEKDIREEISKFAERGCRHGFFFGREGTIAVRLDEDTFLTTPGNVPNRDISAGNIVRVSDGKAENGGIPSHDCKLVYEIFRRHPDVNVIIGACPEYLMSCAVRHVSPDLYTMPECLINLKHIGTVSFEDGYKCPLKAAEMINNVTPVLLWENNKAFTVGKTLTQAFDRLEVSERTAQALFLSERIGKPVDLTEEEAKEFE